MRPTLYVNPGSVKQITSPIVGSGICEDAVPVFNAGYFPNTTAYAIPQDGDATNRVFWEDVVTGGQSTIEFWAKADGWTWNGTVSTDGFTHGFYFAPLTNGIEAHTYTQLHSGNSMYNHIFPGGVLKDLADTTTTVDGNWHHWAITTDYTLVANAQKIYKDGIVVAEANTFSNFTGNPSNFGITCGVYNNDFRQAGFKGWISNLKIYSYAKTDFSDRFRRRSGMNDVTRVY